MSNYTPPPDISDPTTWVAALYNALKNSWASFINNGNLGDSNFSTSPSERLSGSKVDLGGGVLASAHHTRHEPGGADKVVDIDILGTGTLLSAHASRHASGGADPLPAASVTGSMIAPGSISEDKVGGRKTNDTFLAAAFGLTYQERGKSSFAHPNANAFPKGTGVVRNGLVYFSCNGIDAVTQLDPATGTFTNIALAAGDKPRGLCLIGTNIYVICSGDTASIFPKVKKIDINNAVTTTVTIRTDGAAAIATAIAADFIVPNSDGTAIYSCVTVATQVRPSRVARISLTGAGVTHVNDFGAAAAVTTPCFVKVGSTEYVVLIDNLTGAGSTTIRRVLAADLTGGVSVTTASVKDFGTSGVYDGGLLIINDIGATSAIRVYDVTAATMNEIANLGRPSNSPAAGTWPETYTQPPFFDGRILIFPSDTTLSTVLVLSAGRYASGYNARMNGGAARTVNGAATDGIYVWMAVSSAGSNASYDKILLG